jgi:hypothetical protein
VVNGTAIVLSAGYGHGAAMLDVRRTNGAFTARQLWDTRDLESKFNAPVLFGRHLYGFDEQDLVCLDLDTGNAAWRQRRTFGSGQLVLAGTSLIVVSEWGDVALVAATSAGFRQLAGLQALTLDVGSRSTSKSCADKSRWFELMFAEAGFSYFSTRCLHTPSIVAICALASQSGCSADTSGSGFHRVTPAG